MRAIKRASGALVLAAAMAGAAAGPAQAMIAPACTARLTVLESTTCSFDNQFDYATITVSPVGTVRATLRCFTPYGYTYTSGRTVSKPTAYAAWTPGSCSLSLAALTSGATALATSTPTTGPIIDPYPVP